ncbi:DNA-3-methyladenine glycosylase 2 family protein [Aureimonas flava]|uniref:DNA-3-methyladenine glycosylase II n=1 Tax=Aureimonas flava TaxID=2320271 RepID=A0A3A1WKU9_9HYPH|nr:DNA-3-methyladenine glycosylase [Aureimonas flava]RIX99986.1 DNA-3-methyladenine glycosylase 2 family protein [Aureimonas flava]
MIRSQEDVDRGLARLVALDPRLAPVAAVAGPTPLRPGSADLPGLVATVVAQQVSRASAAAILGRLAALVDLSDAGALRAASDETLRQAGLSGAKARTVRALAAAIGRGELDLRRVAEAPPEEAIRALVAIPGIGRWTAECHLLFGVGHPDIFPAGDLALRIAVGRGVGLGPRPAERAVALAATAWSPLRSVAARLFWAYYAALLRRDAAPVAGPPVLPGPSAR